MIAIHERFPVSLHRLFYYSSLAFCFAVPIKISLSYVTLFVTYALFFFLSDRRSAYEAFQRPERFAALLLVVVAAVALMSFQPWNSLFELVRFSFVCSFFFPLVYAVKRYGWRPFAWSLVLGQTVASVHSFFDGMYGHTLPRLFVGTVSESGQLSMSVFLAAALFFAGQNGRVQNFRYSVLPLVAIASQVLLLVYLASGEYVPAVLFATASGLAFTIIVRARHYDKGRVFLLALGIPLLVTALILNAKRGPLFAVLVCSLIAVVRLHGVRGSLLLVVFALGLWVYEPLLQRIVQSADHLTISGGRTTIWEVGTELAVRYPMGIGFRGSRVLSNFCETIPENLNHFHSNYLNVLVEGGWLGLLLFLTWIAIVLRTFWRGDPNSVFFWACLAFISWHLAGLVEYNLGDSEVFFMSLITLVLLRGSSLRFTTGLDR